jgi:hypothetical protein
MSPEPRATPDVLGVVRSLATREGLPGYTVEALPAASAPGSRPLARGRSDLGGFFGLRLSPAGRPPSERESAGAAPIVVVVRNPFGHEVHRSAPIDRAARARLLSIDIRVDGALQRPAGPRRPDAFQRVADRYRDEGAAFRNAGVSSLATLRSADLGRVSAASGIDRARLGAFRLEAELGDDGMDRQSALAIVRATGVDSRALLASASARDIARALGSDGADARVNARAVTWTRAAAGHDVTDFALEPPAELTRKVQRLIDRVAQLNPTARMLSLEEMQDPTVKQRAVAHARGLMREAGVQDLATLGSFLVRGRRKIEPGFHIARPWLDAIPDDRVQEAGSATDRLVAFGQQRYERVELHPDSIHFVTNPITDAVILGSIVELADDGELVIGQEVSKLTIITDKIVYGDVIRISYEDKERVPITPAQATAAAKGKPDNVPTVFSKEPDTDGPPDQGRHGGRGTDGADGTEQHAGDVAGFAPDLTIYVKSTPRGLPDIDVEGRRGGQGQAGQEGGRGGNGARGGPSKSGVFSCLYAPGRGGVGGRGGDGGRGATGGRGGAGGSVQIITVRDNVDLVDSGREAFIDMNGGPGGPGGPGAAGGAGGIGGLPGENKGFWCSGLTLLETKNGAPGNPGADGARGERGRGGEFSVITLSDEEWNAAIDRPWIVRLEPWDAYAGEAVTVVGLNLIPGSVVLFEGTSIVADSIGPSGDTLTFTVPADARGGQRTVRLEATDSEGNPVRTDAVELLVLPKLLLVTPDNGVPNKLLTLLGSGFHPDSQVEIGGVSFVTTPSPQFPATRLEVTLPDHEHIGLSPGELTVRVINPDGSRSNAKTFELSLEIVIRLKAWRVMPDASNDYPHRTAEKIQDMLMNGVLAGIWGPHHIHFFLDSQIDDIVVPADVGVNWPRGGTDPEINDILRAKDSDGHFLHFDEHAVNFYFVHNIDEEEGGHDFAFVDRIGNLEKRSPGSCVIFADSALGVDDEARFAAHELGHIMSLEHPCDNEYPEASRYKRECTVDDRRYLMYAGLEKVLTHFRQTDISPPEAAEARLVATALHKPWQD